MSEHQFSIVQGRAVSDRRVTNSQFRTLSALGMYADKNGWCFPKQNTIGEDIGKTQQRVSEDIAALAKLGYIQIVPQYDPVTNARIQNKYRLLHDTPPTGNVEKNSVTPTGNVEKNSVDNVPLNVPYNTASGEITLCQNCSQPIRYEERDTVWFHIRKTGREDNGYYCRGNEGKFAQPKDVSSLPIDWQIAAGVKTVVVPDEKDNLMKDAATLIGFQMGTKAEPAWQIAYTFMRTRGIILPASKAKGQRKAIKEMLEMGVRAEHVAEATKMLIDNKMTVTDLFSVSKTAIALATPAPDEGYTGAIEGV